MPIEVTIKQEMEKSLCFNWVFRVHEKMDMEIENSLEQDIIKKRTDKLIITTCCQPQKALSSKRDATGRGHASWQIKPYPADLSNIRP